MRIKQVEELVGITSKNIRFYEEQQLISPQRADNGYREYSQEDIELLKKIKLFRKLGVPVEEIRRMFAGDVGLQHCLEERMKSFLEEQENLKHMYHLTDVMLSEVQSIRDMDTDFWLEEMEKQEKEGVDFVNLDKIDVHMKKKAGAIGAAVVLIAFMLILIVFMIWMNFQEEVPIIVNILYIGILSITIIAVLVVMVRRIKEIDGGEEDEAAKY